MLDRLSTGAVTTITTRELWNNKDSEADRFELETARYSEAELIATLWGVGGGRWDFYFRK